MKKIILFLSMFVLTISLVFSLTSDQQFSYVKAKDQHVLKQNNSLALEISKKAEYLQYNMEREMQYTKASEIHSILPEYKISDVQIVSNEDSLNSVPDYSGDFIYLGTCTNIGSTSAVFMKINAMFYDSSDNYIGSDFTYISGGSNAQLSSTGSFVNALGPGQTGYFKIWTNFPYSQVHRVEYVYNYETYDHSLAYASVDFVGSPIFSADYSDDLKCIGQIINSSNFFLTYFTKVYFAILDDTGKVQNVDFTYVDGSTYDYGLGNTDTALFPGETGSFSNSFSTEFSNYSSYLNSFEWHEASNSGLEEQGPPFGDFSTPDHGSTVASSVPVTGWVLDDTGVNSVKIYRGEIDNLIYIGDASFVEGARPDIAQIYPEYPNNTKAGWGYMMLTNFLPNQGNGTFSIHAIATDAYGKTTTLGTKIITCDNANAIKPFGAIDTPTQGGTVTGPFFNSGWALTPMPNKIPIDGSTINVWVDGVKLGNPDYNQRRQDIVDLFPGYENTNGAVGAYYLDTTTYTNGVHTIAWSVKDNVGNTDGIGSRFFTIDNTGGSSQTKLLSQNIEPSCSISFKTILNLPVNFEPIEYRKGYKEDIRPLRSNPDEYGLAVIESKEVERVEIKLGNGILNGFVVVSDELRPLPIGSTFDVHRGIFFWQPGPGFIGEYDLVFIKVDEFGVMRKIQVKVKIRPKFGIYNIDFFKNSKEKGESADPGLPEAEDVRKRLAGLKGDKKI